MRSILPWMLVTLAACSSHTNAPPSTGPTQTVRVAGNAGLGGNSSATAKVAPSSDVHFDTVAVGIDQLWKMMPSIYAALDIPIANFDAERNLIGNAGMKAYRRLGKTPLTKLLDCGRTQIGPSAETYDITMAVMTRLTRVDSLYTAVVTTVEASGRPMQYAGGETRCRTTGELERQIILQIQARHP